jgi:hypothetical protein
MNKHPRDKIRRNVEDSLELDEFLQRPKKEFEAASGFCQALQVEVASTAFDQSWKDVGKRWAGFPWVTFVLGSGPVGLPDPFWRTVKSLPLLVEEAIESSRHEGNTAANIVPMSAVKQFLASLTRERIGELDGIQSADEHQPIGEFTAALVLVAAQLTRVFHTVSMLSSRPVSRWGSVVAQAPRQGDAEHDLLAVNVIALQRALDYARERLQAAPPEWKPGDEFFGAVDKLLVAVARNLSDTNKYMVNLEHLREVTDVAWQCLVWEVCGHSYPGWTELMLDLVLLQERTEAPVERRPRWGALQELSKQIDGLIRPAAGRSWELRWALPPANNGPTNSPSDATRDFYRDAATLLWTQAEVARAPQGRNKGSDEPVRGGPRTVAGSLPKAVAFVTSFDLELEMALLHTRPDGMDKLSVVVPVYLVNGEEREGEFLWLEGIIDLTDIDPSKTKSGEDVLNSLTQPKEWRVMYEGRLDMPDHPIVVRLTGSPLMDLPPLPGEPVSALELDGESTLAFDLEAVGVVRKDNDEFVHSATVDEYLALRQAEAEYFWVYSRGSIASVTSRALPKSLLNCGSHGPIRFWMTVGVPMKDPAVRLRVLSQMSNRRFMLDGLGDVGEAENEPTGSGRGGRREIPGMAVNWRLDDEESMLLSALGLRVIKQGRAENLAKYLAHHAWHLGAFAANEVPRAGIAKCPQEPAAKRKKR